MRIRRGFRPALAAASLVLPVLVPGCGNAPDGGPPQAPPHHVAVQVITSRPVRLTTELPGRVTACLTAEIRPQVGGIIKQRFFTEGSDVKAGDALYLIDPEVYQADYQNAQAALTQAKAGLARARAEQRQAEATKRSVEAALDTARTALISARAVLAAAEASAEPLRLSAERLRTLLADRTVSQQAYDDASGAAERADAEVERARAGVRGAETEIAHAEAAVRVAVVQIESATAGIEVAQAGIESAQATLEAARIRLGFTRITAPIAGRIGRSAVTIGALVSAYQPMALTTIHQLDPIHVDVRLSTARQLRLKRRIARGEIQVEAAGSSKVDLLLEDGSTYARQGSLQFSDVSVDPSMGSVALRTVFSNPDAILLPGMFARAVIEEGVQDAAILVPQQAVQHDPKGRPFALTVGTEERAEMHMLTLERAVGDAWLVASGLRSGDRLIVDGFQRLRPGMAVIVVPQESTEASPPAFRSDRSTRDDESLRATRMLSRFFLDRPVFAWVIAIVLMVLGGLAIHSLPISQYPAIAPPAIAIDSFYPGASAETVENSVTQIIEQKMTGLDEMLYLSGTSDSSGASRVELTFKPGTDPDLAWAKVQNKLQLATASLPEVVQRTGVTVSKSTRNYLIIVGLISEDASMDGNDLRDYAQSNLEKVLARVPGVGEVTGFGSQYAMRVWLDPDKLTEYRLTVEDVILALRDYNVEVSAGQFGGAPAVEGQRLNASIVVQNLLETPEEFAGIPLRMDPEGAVVRVRDVGRTEMGTEFYDVQVFYNGKPTAALAIRQAPGANALDTADAIKAKITEMSRYFPPGMKAVYPYDTTPFVTVAIDEVVKTLIEAIGLVFLIMWLFMGNLRATLIPTIAVPVVLLGTFAVLGLFGYSINMLTMFAMVLAIGLLVDDAIVVVENVERIMTEEGLAPREAAAKSMEQITSALIGIGLVLAAVFGPMAFFAGSTGVIYRQFSVTIIASMLLSVVVALILTPVLCASLLRPVAKGHEPSENAVFFLRPFFRTFDRIFFRIRDLYVALVGHSMRHKLRYIAVYVLLVAGIGYLFLRLPTAYLPDEDQGILYTQLMLPTGSTLEQTQAVADDVKRYFHDHESEAVASVLTISGMGFSGRAQNNGMVFTKLKDWKLRDRPDLKAHAVAARAMAAFAGSRKAMIFTFPPPAVIELGTAQGVELELLDQGGLGHEALMSARNQFLGLAAQDTTLTGVRPNGMEDVPEFQVDIDWERAGALGLSIRSVHNTISAAFGGAYVNDFIQGGRVKRVYVQADAPYRMLPTDLERLYVRNAGSEMVPFDAFASTWWTSGSPRLERYNGFPSLNIWGEAAPGYSSGDAMQAMEALVAKLPQGIGYDWTGLSYQERAATAQGPILYAFSILVIFLCVAALYESWTIPFVNLLMLPLGILGAVLATTLRGLPNDVYFQIGFLTTLGLSTKNAILIIQFIKEERRKGLRRIDATLAAVRVRFRPVIMTSMAFFFGTLPLALASGAGAGAMNAIGTAVTGGMLSATFIDLIFIPLFFVVIARMFERDKPKLRAASR